MKVCSGCRKEKPLEAFNKRASAVDGYQLYCRECQHNHYLGNAVRHKAHVRVRNASVSRALRETVQRYLRDHPCVDCGELDAVVLDFDHVRGVKRFDISRATRRGVSPATLEEEIAKCEIRCANCHRRVTHSRRVSSAPSSL